MSIDTQLTPAIKREIDEWTAKFPADKKASAVLAALTIVQTHEGWVSEESMNAVADYLDMPRIAVYEVATFYTLYNLKPVGKYRLDVCTNISCMLCGCGKIVKHLKDRLNIDFGETTPDGLFTLKEVECLAACGGAPAMQIGKTYYEHLTPEKVDDLLQTLRDKEKTA